MLALRIEKVKFNNYTLLILFYFILLCCFAFVVRNEFAFRKAGLVYELNYHKFSIGIFLVFLCATVLTFVTSRDFLYAILGLVLILLVFPSIIMFTYVKNYDIRILSSHLILFFAIGLLGKLRIRFKSKKISARQGKHILLVLVITGLIPFIIVYAPYININNLLLLDIYETRELMSNAATSTYTDYTYSWFNKCIIPCLLVFGIYFRDKLVVLICTLSLIFLFLCGAHKAVFAGLIITFLFYRFSYLRKINFFLKFLILIALVSLSLSAFFGSDFLMTLTIRRVLLLPALVDNLYFDLFDNNHLYWSETFNGLIIDYPYTHSHSYIIGEKFFNNIEWAANNGIISDGFMNWGLYGVLINIFFVAVYFSLLNQLNISPKFFGLFFLFVFLIENGALTTILLTHGGLILILLSFFLLKDTNDSMADT